MSTTFRLSRTIVVTVSTNVSLISLDTVSIPVPMIFVEIAFSFSLI